MAVKFKLPNAATTIILKLNPVYAQKVIAAYYEGLAGASRAIPVVAVARATKAVPIVLSPVPEKVFSAVGVAGW